MTHEMPKPWLSVTLGEIADVRLGKMLDAKRTAGHQLPYLRNINVRWGSVDTSSLFSMAFEDHELDRYGIKHGDLLVCEGGEPGRAAVWTHSDTDLKFQKALHRVRLKGGIEPRFIAYHLRHDAGNGTLRRSFTGTTIHHLTGEALDRYEVRLAPAAEQLRICQALDSYTSRTDEATTLLERAQRNLKRYRASVLKAAVEGRLVPTEAELARAEKRAYEPASALLARILVERRKRWEKEGRRGKYEAPEPPDTRSLPDLPDGWCWARAKALFWDAGYGTSQKCNYGAAGPPVLRIPNVQSGSLRLDDMKFATMEDGLPSDGAVRNNDFIFIRTNGSKNLIGRGALVRDNLPRDHYFASYLIRLRLLSTEGLPNWFALAWHMPTVRQQLLADAASSAGQHNVSLGLAAEYAIPLPPVAEQVRIIEAVERLTSVAFSGESEAAKAHARCQRLRQSILKWAFEGKLVDQDPTDEPASALLARIKGEPPPPARKKRQAPR